MVARGTLVIALITAICIAMSAGTAYAAVETPCSAHVAVVIPEEQSQGASAGLVSYETVAQALELLTATLAELKDQGELTAAAQNRLALLIGGIAGQVSAEAQASLSVAAEDNEGLGKGGPASDEHVYLSQITPSRQITLFSNPESAASPDAPGAQELSVWIDDAGNVFVAGDRTSPDSVQQLSLKQGWEKDYDKLSGQIEQMLAEFMKQHAADQPPAEDGASQPGAAI